jgi:hypothetical protein
MAVVFRRSEFLPLREINPDTIIWEISSIRENLAQFTLTGKIAGAIFLEK